MFWKAFGLAMREQYLNSKCVQVGFCAVRSRQASNKRSICVVPQVAYCSTGSLKATFLSFFLSFFPFFLFVFKTPPPCLVPARCTMSGN